MPNYSERLVSNCSFAILREEITSAVHYVEQIDGTKNRTSDRQAESQNIKVCDCMIIAESNV
jgi:hypothetical protein